MNNWSNGMVAVVGGTGALGSAIARRLAKAGVAAIVGSRSAASAAAKAEELGLGLTEMANAEAATTAELVIVTESFAAQKATLSDVSPFGVGKTEVDTTLPLMTPRVIRVQLPSEGSAAARARSIPGDDVWIRRIGTPELRHADRGHGCSRRTNHRGVSAAPDDTQCRLKLKPAGHNRFYASLTDVTKPGPSGLRR
jgi:hypothetical protein